MSRSVSKACLLALALTSSTLSGAFAQKPLGQTGAARPASPAELLEGIDIPYQSFTLPNGLQVYVATDHTTPVVSLSVWYKVGSANEPAGKTGYAHLFEHLMFAGSENVRSFDNQIQLMGGSRMNGSTDLDHTNYFETVPTSALDRILYMESDRMGYLLGGLRQERLDNQRAVVQNEKRQGDNEPRGMLEYTIYETLFPEGHPYHHTPIGSMADLDAASITDMRNWFTGHYGPNNAVIVLAGDIDLATAKTKMAKYFGPIPRGPQVARIDVPVPTLPARRDIVVQDRVANTQLRWIWTIPGNDNADAIPLEVGAAAFGGLAGSRLNQVLVREEQLATGAAAVANSYGLAGTFQVRVDVKPGVDPDQVARRVEAIMADYLRTGPDQATIDRVAMSRISTSVGGIGTSLGRSLRIGEAAARGNAGLFKKELEAYTTTRPKAVTAAMRKWLTRPVLALRIVPGDRPAYTEAKAAKTIEGPTPALATVKRSPIPALGGIGAPSFPALQRSRLTNGIELIYTQRTGAPVTEFVLSFDAGTAADRPDRRGTQGFMSALLDEGAGNLTNTQISRREEELGLSLGIQTETDTTTLRGTVLSGNLTPSLALLADITQRPTFVPKEIERVSTAIVGDIDQDNKAGGAAMRLLMPALYGRDHPYGSPHAYGYPAVIKSITREELVKTHNQWIRPDKLKIFVVSDQPLETIRAKLNDSFGNWQAQGPAGQKNFAVAIPPVRPRVLLVDMKGAPQSLIFGGQVLPVKGTQDQTELTIANDVLGDGSTSRITQDLRETKGWSYGGGGGVRRLSQSSVYMVSAPVQADKTGPSVALLREIIDSFLTTKGVTAEELDQARDNDIRSLPGRFESSSTLLSQMVTNDAYRRPDDYFAKLPARLKALTPSTVNGAARAAIKPDQFVWVVAGDAALVRPQLESLGLPVEVVAPR